MTIWVPIRDSIPQPQIETSSNALVTLIRTATDEEYLDVQAASDTEERYKKEGPSAFVSNEEVKQRQRKRRSL